jgi:hypothetical protein
VNHFKELYKNYWFPKLWLIYCEFKYKLNNEEKALKEKYFKESSIIEFMKERKLIRKQGFFETNTDYNKYLYKSRLNHIKEYIDCLSNEIYKLETTPKLYPSVFHTPQSIPEIVMELSKGFDRNNATLALIKTDYIEHEIKIQFGVLLMICLSLWYLKHPKKMTWWEFIGLESEDDEKSKLFMNNTDYLMDVFKKCGWKNDVDRILMSLKYLLDINIHTTIIVENEDNHESLIFFIQCMVDNKMDLVYFPINTYLKNLKTDLGISSFSYLLDSFTFKELKRRFEKAKLIITEY